MGAGGGGGGRLVKALTYLETYSFLHSGTPSVLLLTAAEDGKKAAKAATAPSWLSSLAVKYKDGKKFKVHFGFADGGKEAAIAQRFGVATLPALIVSVPPADGADGYYFQHKIPTNAAAAVKELKSFIDDATTGLGDAKLRTPLPAFPQPDVPRKQAAVSFAQLTEENAHSACLGGAKGACVLALVNAPGGELAPATHAALEAVAKKYRNDPLTFAWLHASAQPEFCAALGVASTAAADLPRLLVLKLGKRARAALMPQSDLTAAAVESFVDKVLGGDVQFAAVKGGVPELLSAELRAAMAASEAEDAPAAGGHEEL